jgi:ABC-type branched-subunit amino acid transport system substrate-binding protein
MPDSPRHLPGSSSQARRYPRLWLIATALLIVLTAGGIVTWRIVTRPTPIHIAFANSLSGAVASEGTESLAAARLYVDEINRAGGVDGHEIVLDPFDDRSSAKGASANVRAIADGPAIAVLGHLISPFSLAAGDGYKAARIPALTSQSVADELTIGNPWYFRLQTPNTATAEWLAFYIRNVLQGHSSLFARAADIDLVLSNDAFGGSFKRGFLAGSDGQTPKTWTYDDVSQPPATAAKDIAEALAQEPEPRIIVLGVSINQSPYLVKAIRRRGIRTIIVVLYAGTDDYLQNFAAEPEEHDTPGFFSDNLFTTAAVIFDTIGSLGQEFAEKYAAAMGKRPSWWGAKSNDGMRMLVEALRRAHPANTAESKVRDREKIRDALASFDSPEHAVPGLDGPLWFNANRDMPRASRFGMYERGRLVSAPIQLVTVQNPDLVDLPKEMRAGHIVNMGDRFFWLQRVVYAGIDIAHLGGIDLKAGTFNVDFFLWLRYGGQDDLPSHIELPGLRRGGFDPGHPAETGTQDDLNYRVWRVSGDIKAEFDLHDFPFDTQSLLVRFQNPEAPRQQIAYVIDTFGLHLHRPDPGPIGARGAFRDLELWRVTDIRYFVDAFSISSTQGKTAFFDTDDRNEYGGFDTAIVVRRDVAAFMVKTLVPLFLLVLVVFATLFFPSSLAKERTTIPVTGILTSAVLLISIGNQLPSLGYTMALEYIFYVFFALCLMAMCAGFIGEILRNRTYHGHAIAVDLIARVAYGIVVLVTSAAFVWMYAIN